MKPLIVRRHRMVPIPADVIWQFVEPAESLPSWLPLADRCDAVSGEGLGRRQRMSGHWGPKAFEIDQEVTGYEPNALLRWTHIEERVDGRPAPKISSEVTVTVRLQPVGLGTVVVLESRNMPANAMAAILLRLVARRRIDRAFRRALQNLVSAAG